MKIEVKNFGPIKKGTIDLDKRVTVFVGYNNSGKTYMSQLLWGLDEITVDFISDEEYWDYDFEYTYDDNLITFNENVIAKVFKQFSDFSTHVSIPTLFNIDYSHFLIKDLSIGFEGQITKIKSLPFKFILVKTQPGVEKVKEYYLFKKAEDCVEFEISKVELVNPMLVDKIFEKEEVVATNFHFGTYNEEMDLDYCIRYAITSSIIFLSMYNDFIPFFLPANRLFYPSFYKYIYSVAKEENDLINDALRKRIGQFSLKSLSKRPYAKATDDLIKKIYSLNTISRKPNNDELLEELIDVIGGDIELKSAEGIAPIEFYLKLGGGEELDMYMSSSSANQLTTLYLYLKYWAEEENNYLIIDEPEENLHPENQIKLVNILMKFADRNNNKVLITTHSPLITDHINNYANLSYLKEAGTDVSTMVNDEYTHMADIQTIKHSDYGVYFFNGNEIEEYEVGNYGAYFEDFQKAENKVKETSDILKNHIYDNINNNARKSFQNKSK